MYRFVETYTVKPVLSGHPGRMLLHVSAKAAAHLRINTGLIAFENIGPNLALSKVMPVS